MDEGQHCEALPKLCISSQKIQASIRKNMNETYPRRRGKLLALG